MPIRTRPRSRQISVIRTRTAVPTLSQMIRDGQESAAKIKRATKEALTEWFAQSERLNIARAHYGLRGERFADFASRIGIDRASAYQLVNLLKHRTAILARCRDEGRYYGWETCLYWFERDPRRSWHRSRTAVTPMSTAPRQAYSNDLAQPARWMCAPRRRRQCVPTTSPRHMTD
jgi:hypothetical protein